MIVSVFIAIPVLQCVTPYYNLPTANTVTFGNVLLFHRDGCNNNNLAV